MPGAADGRAHVEGVILGFIARKRLLLWCLSLALLFISNVIMVSTILSKEMSKNVGLLSGTLLVLVLSLLTISYSSELYQSIKGGQLSPSAIIKDALAAYLASIVVFGLIFYLIYTKDGKGKEFVVIGPKDISTFIYFSMTTMATVGFGDIYPTGRWARAAVCLEILLGVFFTIGLFAVISSYLSNRLVGTTSSKG